MDEYACLYSRGSHVLVNSLDNEEGNEMKFCILD